MTQYLRGQQAYPATTQAVVSAASSEIQNWAYMNQRLQAVITPSKGTTAYSQSWTQSTTARWMEIPDPLYASFVTAGYVPAAGDTSQNTLPSPTPTLNSNQLVMWNPGVHRQVVDFWGDSITASDIGGGTYPLMGTQAVFFFMQPIVQMGVPYVYQLSSDTQGPNYCYTCASLTSNRSRLHRNFGQDSCRAANVSGYTYVQGMPWLNNVDFGGSGYIFPNQQHVNVIWLGTNDFQYATTNGNAGLFSVPTGSVGYTYPGTPNYITVSLIPFIAALKAADPTCKILFIGSIARGNDSTLSGRFVDVINYIIANQTALGVDLLIDTRTFAKYSPANAALSTNLNWYQNDDTHMTPAGYIDRVYGLPARVLAALDQLLGF